MKKQVLIIFLFILISVFTVAGTLDDLDSYYDGSDDSGNNESDSSGMSSSGCSGVDLNNNNYDDDSDEDDDDDNDDWDYDYDDYDDDDSNDSDSDCLGSCVSSACTGLMNSDDIQEMMSIHPYTFRARLLYQGLNPELWGVVGDVRLDFGAPLIQAGLTYLEEGDLKQTNEYGERAPDVDVLREIELMAGLGVWTGDKVLWHPAVMIGWHWVTGDYYDSTMHLGIYNEVWLSETFAFNADIAVNRFNSFEKWDFEGGAVMSFGNFGIFVGYQGTLYYKDDGVPSPVSSWMHGFRLGAHIII